MTRQRFVGILASVLAVLSLTVLSAWAGQEGSRTSNGNTVGTAVARGGDSGGGAVSRGGDSGGGSSSGSSGGGVPSSMGSAGGSSPTPSAWTSFEQPSRADQQGSRSRGGNSSSGQAVSRGGGGNGGGGNSGGSSPRGASASSGSSDRSASAPTRRAVPEYSRPRDGRPVTGQAAERGSVPGGGGGYPIYPVYPSYPYYPWGFWGPGYGYGLGYLYYDPFWYGGFGFGYGGYGYGGYGGGGGYSSSQSYRETGHVRLKIEPKDAQVYIDGYYVGVVDSFDGAFQKLGLDSGGHRVELKAEGYEPLEFEVLITPGETVTYKGEMKRIK
jgi:hypothetical protein